MKFATIEYNYVDDLEPRIAEVAIVPNDYFSDPANEIDEEIDERIFFYFTEAEFELVLHNEQVEWLEFNVLRTHEDCENCAH